MSSTRLSSEQALGRGIDRDREIQFSVDGVDYRGFAGDTIASALIASGRIDCGPSMYLGRPRGVLAAGVEEPNALVHVQPRYRGDIEESMLSATLVEISEGLEARYLSGLGTLDPAADETRYEHKHVHVDVLVVGAGPAGITAAREAAKGGARTMLMDSGARPGGSLLGSRGEKIDGIDAVDWAASTVDRSSALEDFTYLPRTTALGSYDSNYVVAVEDRTAQFIAEASGVDGAGGEPRRGRPRQRIWHVRAARVILATGAHERPIVFRGNDRPGIMLAGAVRSYLNKHAVAAGSRIAVFTTNDAAYALVDDLHASGVEVVAVIDSRAEVSAQAQITLDRTAARGIFGAAVVDTAADSNGRISEVTVSAIDADGALVGELETISTDLLAVSGGFSPVIHLHTQRQGKTVWDGAIGGIKPAAPVREQALVGAVAGDYALSDALTNGADAGHRAGHAVGFAAPLITPEASAGGRDYASGPVRPLWLVPSPSGVSGAEPGEWNEHFVDLQRDQTVADVYRATGAGMRGIEHVKRYTSISTANDQGKTSGVNAIGVIAAALQRPDLSEFGVTSHRAPYMPVSFAAVAGRRRGELFDPARITSIQPWHVEHGAEFEDVGQWKRPWYYPQPGEDMDAAVLRECAAVRRSVGFQDASTLGKIEIRGGDSGEFLNRIYTNGFAKLGVGKARYGFMCTPDGMVFDDGVTLRVADDRYYMTTTTGGAAKVLEWLEEWHQTEWPQLDVVFTSVTEQWNTIAVVGPRSRDVIAKIAPQLDVSQDAFAFMEFRETELSNGVPARIARISFSGELAFEVNVENFYGLSTWKLIAEAGAEFDITPYGTETMHVLRAEKGFIIVGQDTDGTVTPQDAGMDWIVSKLKDFVGKRSYSRQDTERPDRKHLVGVLPVNTSYRLPEGAQLVTAGTPITPQDGPVPMIGHVTSSYNSPTLGRTFGLAMVENGRGRMGEIVQAPLGGELIDVEITSPVFYDPEGNRRDG